MGMHIDNVLMQQSTGLKSNLPESRPVAELLVALNEFNKYELYTGTGTGVQPLFGDTTGSSNISFDLTQQNANAINGCFVYFDNASGTWKPAYAQANPVANEHYTAQGFAVSSNTSDVQITTSGKLQIPFRLKDYAGNNVVTGSYYYLCQEQSNAGKIQQSAPTSGIMQVVCQIIAADDSSTTMLLLNDLNQVADDIIQTDGDGSKYLGDDGQYHNMQIAGLAGRTANCINEYEVLDISYNNIAAGAGSYGYVAIGDVTIENNIASGFSKSNYLISKYLIDDSDTQYTFDIKQTFPQVEIMEPIFSCPNSTNYLAMENGSIKFVMNNLVFKGNTVFTPGTYYIRFMYNKDSGYTVSISTDGTSYTNELVIYDSHNHLAKATWYLGVLQPNVMSATGSIDLSATGFSSKNNTAVTTNFPLSSLTDKNIATITVTAKITGLTAAGRAAATGTLLTNSVDVDTENNTIIANDNDTLIWDTTNGLTTCAYEETDYLRNYEDDGVSGKIVYAKDTNKCYQYTIVYPNFLETGLIINKDTKDYLLNVESGVTIAEDSNKHVIASNFNTNAFVDTLSPMDYSKPWEWHTKINVSTVATNSVILDTKLTDRNLHKNSIGLTIKNDQFVFYASSTGESFDIAQAVFASSTITAGTYYIKISWTGTQYLVDASIDNTTWTNYITVNSELSSNSTPLILGSNQYNNYLHGTIDLTETYFVSDGTIVWSATKPNPTENDTKISFVNPNASFHPNTFLNRNGFNFNLNLDLTGKLKLNRMWSALNYGGTANAYLNVQGVDWSTFINDGGYVQGIKISSYLGTNNVGTGANSLNKLTTNDATYWHMTAQTGSVPAIAYFAFEKPVNFDSIVIRNAGSANYMPQIYAIHVSNDLNNWYNVIPETQTGFVKNGMFGNIPIDAYATWPSTTINAYITQPCKMPDENEYYKYVRLCLYQTTNYIPEISGFWIGSFADAAAGVATARMKELIFEKEDFINQKGSGIHASVVRKKTGTAYQVKFLDKLGWTNVAPEDAVIDSTGAQLVPNEALIYHDPRQTEQIAQQTLAYQTHCKQYLHYEPQYGYSWAINPFATLDATLVYGSSATTGTVADSWKLLQTNNSTVYPFANGANESAFVISMPGRVRVSQFVVTNQTAVNYNPQQIRLFGSIDGGTVQGTFVGGTPNPDAQEAVWEEIPIVSIWNDASDGSLMYKATQQQLSFVQTANYTNELVKAGSGTALGQVHIEINPKKAYVQYKVVVQRTRNNSVTLLGIRAISMEFDPWETPKDTDGNPLPIIVARTFFPSSSATALPDKSITYQPIYTSPYSPTTVYQLCHADNANWTPGNNRQYVYVQQCYGYPVCLNSISGQHGNDLNYAANLMESYGTNYTPYAAPLSNTNSLKNWTRLASLNEKCDIPTSLSVATKSWSINLGQQEYGYSYFTHLFARTLNNSIYLDYLIGAVGLA